MKINTNQLIGRSLGVIGMMFPIAANFIPPSNERASFFLIGSIMMLVAALVEFDAFFVALQIVVGLGAATYFLPLSTLYKGIIPIGCAAIFMFWFFSSGRLRDPLTLFGSFGIAFLSLGYGVGTPILYFIGGLILAIYSSISFYRGSAIALLWALLNTFFTIAVLCNMIYFKG